MTLKAQQAFLSVPAVTAHQDVKPGFWPQVVYLLHAGLSADLNGMQDTRVIRAPFHVHARINSERTVNVSKFLHAKKEDWPISVR